MGSGKVRILVADDHTLLRQALADLLKAQQELWVVGQAGTGQETIRIAEEEQPDVVLLDIEMPGIGVEATVHGLLERAPSARIIVLTMHDDQQLVYRLLSLGARAYIHKSASAETLISTIQDVGKSHSATVTIAVSPRSLHDDFAEPGRRDVLSPRELEVLAFVSEALSNRQIGARLDISEGTVKRHLRSIFTKLGAVSRLDAVNKALEASLLPRPDRAGGRVPPAGDATGSATRPRAMPTGT